LHFNFAIFKIRNRKLSCLLKKAKIYLHLEILNFLLVAMI
jgi:hypothetical protein